MHQTRLILSKTDMTENVMEYLYWYSKKKCKISNPKGGKIIINII